MNIKVRVMSAIAAASLATACGGNNGGGATNNGATNNGATNNGATNNGTSNGTNGTDTNNATNNGTGSNNNSNGTAGNNTTGTNTYTAHDFTCPDDLTPAGSVADLVGTWEADAACWGVNQFELLEELCPTGVLTSYEVMNLSGPLHVRDDNTAVGRFEGDWAAQIYVPATCTNDLGGGTCDGVANLMEASAPDVVANCADEPPTVGDCLCGLTGNFGFGLHSELSDSADGTFTETWLEKTADGYSQETEDWDFETDGTTLRIRSKATTTTFTLTRAAAPATDCEQYCHGWMWTCNFNANVTAYDDAEDCFTQCATFAPGTPGDTSGDSLACRLYHLGAAADVSDTANPNTHCPHAQAAPTAQCI